MRTIYRYPIQATDVQSITGPGLTRFIAVDNRRGELEAWAEVETDGPDMTWTVYVVGTGNPMNFGHHVPHVGHVIDGPFIWHIYAEVQR